MAKRHNPRAHMLTLVIDRMLSITTDTELRTAKYLHKNYPAFRIFWQKTPDHNQLYAVYDISPSAHIGYLTNQQVHELKETKQITVTPI